MKKFLAAFCAAAVSLGTIVSTAAPVAAAPLVPAPRINVQSDVTHVQGEPWRNRGYNKYRGRHYYNGHRGYREYRPGYRRHNGVWFPAGAFIAGALLGGALAAPAPAPIYREPVRRIRMNDSHIRWCYDRYRSYRAGDNTFQPYNGPRQQCYSPYS